MLLRSPRDCRDRYSPGGRRHGSPRAERELWPRTDDRIGCGSRTYPKRIRQADNAAPCSARPNRRPMTRRCRSGIERVPPPREVVQVDCGSANDSLNKNGLAVLAAARRAYTVATPISLPRRGCRREPAAGAAAPPQASEPWLPSRPAASRPKDAPRCRTPSSSAIDNPVATSRPAVRPRTASRRVVPGSAVVPEDRRLTMAALPPSWVQRPLGVDGAGSAG